MTALLPTTASPAFAPQAAHRFSWSIAMPVESRLGLAPSEESPGVIKIENLLNRFAVVPPGCSHHIRINPTLIQSALHKTVEVTCDDLPVLGYQWRFSYHRHGEDYSELVMVSGDTASGIGIVEPGLSLSDLQTAVTLQSRRGWWLLQDDGAFKTRVAAEERWLRFGNRILYQVIETASGRLIEQHDLGFDAWQANVFAINQNDDRLTEASWSTLRDGNLDTASISAFGSSVTAQRATAANGRFNYSPDLAGEGALFDQVQAFYATDKAQRWFEQRFGLSWQGPPLQVFTRFTQDGMPNNAHYQPGIGTDLPALFIGPGDGSSFRNLARDTDVVLHEFAHHIIYRSLKLSFGETGIIHEGTADYFAYAINGDPNLAESIQPGRPWLRSAALENGRRFDDPRNSPDRHYLGQFWSAVLWQLRTEIGESMDRIVFDAIDYLPPAANLADAFAALLIADRVVFPASDTMGARIGAHYCQIIKTGLERGFAQSLRALNGAPCGIDLAEEAESSQAWRNAQLNGPHNGASTDDAHAKGGCGAVAAPQRSEFAQWWLLAPLLFGLGGIWRQKVQGAKHGN